MSRLLLFCLLLSLPGVSLEPEFPGPGQQFILCVASEEVRMSHWIDLPLVIKASDRSRIWAADFPWSLVEHHWLSSHELDLVLRKYPGDRPNQRIQLQLDTLTFRTWEENRQSWSDHGRPLNELNPYLESQAPTASRG